MTAGHDGGMDDLTPLLPNVVGTALGSQTAPHSAEDIEAIEADVAEALDAPEPIALPPVLVELLTAGVEILTLEPGKFRAIGSFIGEELGLLGRDTVAYLDDYEFAEYLPGAVPIALDGGGGFFCLDVREVLDGSAENNGGAPIVWTHAGNLGWEPDACYPVAADLATLLLA